jgi:hypothetical protein
MEKIWDMKYFCIDIVLLKIFLEIQLKKLLEIFFLPESLFFCKHRISISMNEEGYKHAFGVAP